MPNETFETELTLAERVEIIAEETQTEEITTAQFVNLLSELAEGKYSKGYVRMASAPSGFKKTGNDLFGRVIKLSGWGFDLNADYSRKVNLQLQREGKEMNFEALPTWAEPINKVVYRKVDEPTKLYMSVFPMPNFGQFTAYFVDNRPATAEEVAQIKSFLPVKKESEGRQGTDKKIEIRRPLLSNILTISLQGKRYSIKENIFDLKDR